MAAESLLIYPKGSEAGSTITGLPAAHPSHMHHKGALR